MLIAALVLAVASVGTVGFFADRVKGVADAQANLLLGADLMISGDRPLPSAYAERATQRGLAATPVIRFNSMVHADAACAGERRPPFSPTSRRSARAIRCAAAIDARRSAAAAKDAWPKDIPKRGEVWLDYAARASASA